MHGELRIFSFTKEILGSKFPFLKTTSIICDIITLYFCSSVDFGCGLSVNTLSVNSRGWSNPLKQFVGKVPTNCLSVFDHFGRLALKGSRYYVRVFF